MKKKRILIVDDKETMKFLLTETLKPLGYKIVTAENGDAAIKQLIENVCDLVIADYTISKINCLELLQRIKTINPSLPILVINTNGFKPEILQKGALACIPRPFNPSQLQLICRLLLND